MAQPNHPLPSALTPLSIRAADAAMKVQQEYAAALYDMVKAVITQKIKMMQPKMTPFNSINPPMQPMLPQTFHNASFLILRLRVYLTTRHCANGERRCAVQSKFNLLIRYYFNLAWIASRILRQ